MLRSSHDERIAPLFSPAVLAMLVAKDPLSPEWAEMICKVDEVDPLVCPQCQGRMRVIAFFMDYSVMGRIISQLKLSFVADKPPLPHVAYQHSSSQRCGKRISFQFRFP